MSETKRPNCFACIHFYITHEPSHPYGCEALNFKSKQLPAIVVFTSSGIHCQLFTAKESGSKNQPGNR